MSLTSWFTKPHGKRDATQNGRDPQPRRWPTHSRPSLEHLEERTLLDASSGLTGGANNPTLNSAPVSSGVVLPTAQNSVASLALAVASSLPAQDQNSSQFRAFGVNSQGPNSQFDLNSQLGILTGASGFGSGTQPNAPWAPNAYNLGLANRQFNYSSQSDFGFQPVPPWTLPLAHSLPKDQAPDENEETPMIPEQALVQKSSLEQEQTQQKRMDEDAFDTNEDAQALLEQSVSEKQHLADEALMQSDASIPDSVWLSALAPAPMAALVAGLPGLAPASEGGDIGAEAPE